MSTHEWLREVHRRLLDMVSKYPPGAGEGTRRAIDEGRPAEKRGKTDITRFDPIARAEVHELVGKLYAKSAALYEKGDTNNAAAALFDARSAENNLPVDFVENGRSASVIEAEKSLERLHQRDEHGVLVDRSASHGERAAAIAKALAAAAKGFKSSEGQELARVGNVTNAAKTIELFHGTADDITKAVLNGGLVGGASEGADAYAASRGTQTFTTAGRKAAVYMTGNANAAKEFAELAVKHRGGKAVIFKVTVPASETHKLRRDRFASGAVSFKGTIRPSWVTVVSRRDMSESTTEEFYSVVVVDS